MTFNAKTIISIFCILIFLVIVFHHFLFYGSFFELKDILHHEWFAFVVLAFGVGLLVGETLE